MSLLEEAILIAVQAHCGQTDKAGAPYILHPLRVMLRLESEAERIAAVLHDLLEDTAWTVEDLRERGFPADVLAALTCLTRREGEPYGAFIERVSGDPIARRVKTADLEDNMDISRLGALTADDARRLHKYHRAWRRLTTTR